MLEELKQIEKFVTEILFLELDKLFIANLLYYLKAKEEGNIAPNPIIENCLEALQEVDKIKRIILNGKEG